MTSSTSSYIDWAVKNETHNAKIMAFYSLYSFQMSNMACVLNFISVAL